jgi:predicted XRE-type DNA-binding protein
MTERVVANCLLKVEVAGMKKQKFASVWYAISETPEEVLKLTMRSDLMSKIESAVESWKLPQGEAAKRLGITRPRLNDLLRGKMIKFSLDTLASLATRAGLRVQLRVMKPQGKRVAKKSLFSVNYH